VQHFVQSFLSMLAAATDRELARHVKYLKTENRMLRAKLPERNTVSRRLAGRLLHKRGLRPTGSLTNSHDGDGAFFLGTPLGTGTINIV
jgi:hypothetical protein